MPNHVSIKLYSKYDEDNDGDYKDADSFMDEIEKEMKTEERDFDFNVLIPYPEHFALADEARNKAEKQGVSWDKLPKDGYNQGGYEWCSENWGTKWNAYSIVWQYNELYFQTAWRLPRKILVELSKRFNKREITVEYADEDIGNNCGIVVYKNGEVMQERTEETDKTYPWTLFAQNRTNENRLYEARKENEELEEKLKKYKSK